MIETNMIYNIDCLDGMKMLPSDSVDVVFTSPPYADRRKSVYGGVRSEHYIDWFLPISTEIKRILKPSGSFFLNIKPHTHKGERSLYVFELIIALRNITGFKFVDEFCWVKNSYPGKFYGRLKNAFEPIYHFTKDDIKGITFNPTACGGVLTEDTIKRSYRKFCGTPSNGSGMSCISPSIRNIKKTRPSNVIQINNIINQYSPNKDHPATFPVGLVDFFIKTFSNEGDLIVDPFSGSGTSAVSSIQLNRRYIGYELMEKFCNISQKWINTIENNDPIENNDFF